MKLGILHPGEMGVSVAAAMRAAGHEVYWLPDGRSVDTVERADSVSLQPCASLIDLVEAVEGIASVCPPDAAVELARRVSAAGFKGTYLDGNAVAPESAREIEVVVGDGFVDGGIIGPPAHSQGTTRLYVSGSRAHEVVQWFAGGLLEASVISGGIGSASALKMCYAAYTKGTSALLLAVRALAQAEGVNDALVREWDISQPGLVRRSELAALGTAPKAWRFVGEMREIARAFRGAGLPGEFHDAAAELYLRMETLKNNDHVTFDEVLARINDGTSSGGH